MVEIIKEERVLEKLNDKELILHIKDQQKYDIEGFKKIVSNFVVDSSAFKEWLDQSDSIRAKCRENLLDVYSKQLERNKKILAMNEEELQQRKQELLDNELKEAKIFMDNYNKNLKAELDKMNKTIDNEIKIKKQKLEQAQKTVELYDSQLKEL